VAGQLGRRLDDSCRGRCTVRRARVCQPWHTTCRLRTTLVLCCRSRRMSLRCRAWISRWVQGKDRNRSGGL